MSAAATDVEPARATKTIHDVPCMACGCLCDDLTIEHNSEGVVSASPACAKGEQAFRALDIGPAESTCMVRGRPVSIEEACQAAAELLATSRRPVFDGLAMISVEGQQAAARLAERTGGVVLGHASRAQARAHRAAVAAGMVSCTLGEVRERADVVLVWNSKPSQSHPRHFERYSLDPAGRFVPGGRRDRTLVCVGSRDDQEPLADYTVTFESGRDFEAAWTLRALIKGVELDADRVRSLTGVPLETWSELAATIRRARYGALLHDPAFGAEESVEDDTRALLDLVHDLNAVTAFAYVPLAAGANAAGADEAIAWTLGQAGTVDCSREVPEALAGIETLDDLLAARSVDAAVLFGIDPLAESEPAVWQFLGHIPTVVFSAELHATADAATVFLPVAPLERSSGSVFRSDGVCLPLRPIEPAAVPPAAELLQSILSCLPAREV